MTEWPKYQSHKVVEALPISRITSPSRPRDLPTLFVSVPRGVGGEEAPFAPTEPQMALRCAVGDYAVIYRDGYQSVCPKKEFEDGYSAVEPTIPPRP